MTSSHQNSRDEILTIVRAAYPGTLSTDPDDSEDALLAVCLDEICDALAEDVQDRAAALAQAMTTLDCIVQDVQTMIAALQEVERNGKG